MRRLLCAALCALALAPTPALAQASPSPFTSATRYDAMRRVTGTISADPDTIGSGNPFLAVRNTYDVAGRLTKVETGTLSVWKSDSVKPEDWGSDFTPLRTLETQYDAMDRKTRELLHEGGPTGTVRSVTQYSYDNFGRLDCTTVRMNSADFASPPAACTQGTGGQDRITRSFYDAAGQRLQLREGVGVTGVEGAEASWDYNANGQVTVVIDGNGNRAELHYDDFGRQDRWTFPSATRATSFNDASQTTALATAGSVNSGDHEDYTYDNNGNRTQLTKRDGSTIAFTYDALNRVTSKTLTPGSGRPSSQALTSGQYRPVYYGYDLRGLQLYARFDSASGEGVTNSWDGFGRLASSSTDMGGTTRTLTYRYDADGNRLRITHPDSAFFTTDYDGLGRPTYIKEGATVERTATAYYPHGGPNAMWRGNLQNSYWYYDDLQRPAGQTTLFPGAGPSVVWTYTRNAAGQIASVTRDNDAFAWTGHYAVQRPYETNGLNQYSQAGSGAHPTTFTYDANGNLITQSTWSTATSAYVTTSYTYDVENRLVSVSNGATLTYDPLGRLYRTTLGTADTRFLYDGDALVAEYDAAGAMTRRYVHNVGADVPMFSYSGSDLTQISWLHADHQGSIVAVSGSTGSAAINTYDEYGIPGSGNAGRFQYTGQIWLPEIGMYHYKARVYSPTLGRFLQTDPVGYADQFNLYAYVGNDPVNHGDPSGNCRNRDDDGECIVNNRAGEAGAELTRETQAVVRQIDHKIHALSPNARISIRDNRGQVIGVVTGTELKREWARTSWNIVPAGRQPGISGMGNVDLSVDDLEGHASVAANRGFTRAAGIGTVVLHEVSHNTDKGRELTRQFNTRDNPRLDYRPGSGMITREVHTNWIGQSIAGALGEPYICGVFDPGCQ